MPKKIGVITIHYGTNHGSALQALALNRYLMSCGHQSELINYIPKRYGIWNSLYLKQKDKHSLLVIMLYFPFYLIRILPNRIRFNRFLKTNIVLTKKYSNKDLYNNPPIEDVFIVGSDQVWNDDYNGKDEMSYYLDFVKKGEKIAYAASFGKSYPLDNNLVEFIGGKLKSFNLVSVRESDGIKILKQMGIEGAHVVDPVFLISPNEWRSIFNGRTNIRKPNHYILVYVMDGIFEPLLNNAELISKLTGLKIVAIAFKKINDKRLHKCFHSCNPFDFLFLLSHADYVVTNSFHGTAFSILFSRKFLTVGKENYNSRMLSLLEKLNLKERFVESSSTIDEQRYKTLSISPFSETFKTKLDDWIEESKTILKEALE